MSNPDGVFVIVAGNAREAEDYRREKGWSRQEAVYASSPQTLVGRRVRDVYRVGTWPGRRDLDQINAVLARGLACSGRCRVLIAA